jgi:hypothetical protein
MEQPTRIRLVSGLDMARLRSSSENYRTIPKVQGLRDCRELVRVRRLKSNTWGRGKKSIKLSVSELVRDDTY